MRKAFDGRLIIETAPAPEFFVERVTLIESIGRDCVRGYYCILRDDCWQVQYTAVSPMQLAGPNLCFIRRQLMSLGAPNVVLLESH